MNKQRNRFNRVNDCWIKSEINFDMSAIDQHDDIPIKVNAKLHF